MDCMREIFTGHQLAAGMVTLVALIFLANLLNDLGIVKDRASRIYLHEINDFLVMVPFLVLLLEHHIIWDVLSTEFALQHLLLLFLNTDMECVTFGLNWMLKDSTHLNNERSMTCGVF